MAPQYSEIVELLIDGARYNDAEDVQSALDQGADINSQDEQGRSGMCDVTNTGFLAFFKLNYWLSSYFHVLCPRRSPSSTKTFSFCWFVKFE